MADVPTVNGNGRFVINLGPWTGWVTAILTISTLIWYQATWKATIEHDLTTIKQNQPAILKVVEASNEERKQFLELLHKLIPEIAEPEPTPPKKVRTPKRGVGTQGRRNDFADGIKPKGRI